MITYGIGLITFNPKDKNLDSQNAPAINFKIPLGLSENEYIEIQNDIATVGRFVQYTDMYKMMLWNFEDLLNTISFYLDVYIKKDQKRFNMRDIVLNINKDFLNVLTSFRFYLDYMGRNIKNDFGDSSDISLNFEKYCSAEYDSNFSYRFIYHLRNYSQHKGFVIDSIDFGQTPVKENQLQANHYFNVYLNRNSLLDDKKLKKEIRTEIEKLPERIDVQEYIRQCIDSITNIHNQITNDLLIRTVDVSKSLKSNIDKLTYDTSNKNTFPAIFKVEHSDQNVKEVKRLGHILLPIDTINQIISYAQR